MERAWQTYLTEDNEPDSEEMTDEELSEIEAAHQALISASAQERTEEQRDWLASIHAPAEFTLEIPF